MKGFLRAVLLALFLFFVVFQSQDSAYLKGSSSKTIAFPEDTLVLVNKSNCLPEEYIPRDLTIPSVKFTPDVSKDNKLMRREAAESLEAMFKTALSEGVELYCVSGYRSYSSQDKLYDKRVKSQAISVSSKYVAEPGQSEHQTGLAMDVTNKLGLTTSQGSSFGDTPEGKWLENNGHRFGFIIRYPRGKEGITGYAYEPWHIRYVGIDAAEEIWSRGITLEEYASSKSL
jgi:zinc D-Ala-D-Ala carboxypeptidase